jgi:hypothetical protein
MGRGAGMRDVVKLLLRPVSVLSLGLSTMGMMVRGGGAKLGEQEFKTATNRNGVVTEDFLEAESQLSIFKIKEKDAQVTHELITYSAPVEQSA